MRDGSNVGKYIIKATNIVEILEKMAICGSPFYQMLSILYKDLISEYENSYLS